MIVDKIKNAYDSERERRELARRTELERQRREARLEEIKKNRKMNSVKVIAGCIALFGGLCVLTFFSKTASNVGYGFFGVGLLLVSLAMLAIRKIKVSSWDAYEAAIKRNGNTALEDIAARVGKPEDKVVLELQDMIKNEFFALPNYDTNAYLDRDRGLFVMTRNGEPIENLNLSDMEREARESKAAEKAAAAAKWDAESECIKAITITKTRVHSDEAQGALAELELSVRRIEKRVEKQVRIKESNDYIKLQTKYIPKVMTLMEKLREEQVSPEMQMKICETLRMCAGAFDELNKQLTEPEDINTEVDIEMLKRDFASDGLLGKDFNVK